MRKATGQMQEETQELLDHYNNLYNWDYNEMCRFIHNYSEEEFRKHYETYHRLCDDYGTELVENFGLYFDLDHSNLNSLKICTKVTLKQDKTLDFTIVMRLIQQQKNYQVG